MIAINENGKLVEVPTIEAIDEMDLSIARLVALRNEISEIGKELSSLSTSLKELFTT